MMADIERLYQEMVQSNSAPASATRSEVGTDVVTHDSSDEHPNYAAQIADQIDAEEGQQSDGNQSSILSANSARISQSAEQVQAKSDKSSSNN